MLKRFLPTLWPLLLLCFGPISGELLPLLQQQQQTEQLLLERRRYLAELQAVAVAGRLERQEYQALLSQFSELTSLRASDPFRDRLTSAPTLASSQIGSLVNAVQQALASTPPGAGQLEFVSVSAGAQERIGPFVSFEFGLNLRGRFGALPEFLRLLSRVAKSRQLAVSIGELRLDSSYLNPLTGDGLTITLPVRAYVRD